MSNPASKDIATYLAAQSALGLTFGDNLHVSEIPDIGSVPDECVGVIDTGGLDPLPNISYKKPTVQVRVRGAKGAYADTWALADLIRDALHGVNNETIGGTRYIQILQVGDIISMGYDDNRRPIFSINFGIHRSE